MTHRRIQSIDQSIGPGPIILIQVSHSPEIWTPWTERACAHRPVGDHYGAGAEQALHELLQRDMRMVPIEDDAESVAELRAERRDDHAVADGRIPVRVP